MLCKLARYTCVMRLLTLVLLFCISSWPATSRAAVALYGVEVVHTYPHDPTAFTEGLFYLNGFFYESTGLEQQSSIRKVRVETGEVLQKVDIPPQYFGEGIVNWEGRLVSLTWRSQVGFVFDLATLKVQKEFHYQGEGWALTQNGQQLIMSDGTPELRFLNPKTLLETKRIQVTLEGQPVNNVNELEWVKGEIYANVWETNLIVRIDPKDGHIVGVINLAGLLAHPIRSAVRTACSMASHTTPRGSFVRDGQKLAQVVRDPPGAAWLDRPLAAIRLAASLDRAVASLARPARRIVGVVSHQSGEVEGAHQDGTIASHGMGRLGAKATCFEAIGVHSGRGGLRQGIHGAARIALSAVNLARSLHNEGEVGADLMSWLSFAHPGQPENEQQVLLAGGIALKAQTDTRRLVAGLALAAGAAVWPINGFVQGAAETGV